MPSSAVFWKDGGAALERAAVVDSAVVALLLAVSARGLVARPRITAVLPPQDGDAQMEAVIVAELHRLRTRGRRNRPRVDIHGCRRG